ncbi:MAG TPA: ABC transporter substrate-binding protein, partial [Streptosporangiaceae bacterium]
MIRRPLGLAAAALAGVLAIAACGSGSPSAGGTGTSPGGSASGAAFNPAHKGGVVHLVAQAAGGTLDPQVNYTLQYWQLYQATYDQLVTFERVGTSASNTIIPD